MKCMVKNESTVRLFYGLSSQFVVTGDLTNWGNYILYLQSSVSLTFFILLIRQYCIYTVLLNDVIILYNTLCAEINFMGESCQHTSLRWHMNGTGMIIDVITAYRTCRQLYVTERVGASCIHLTIFTLHTKLMLGGSLYLIKDPLSICVQMELLDALQQNIQSSCILQQTS